MVRIYKTNIIYKNIMPHFVTEYMDDLFTEVLKKIEEPRSSLESRLHSTPPPLCATFTNPNCVQLSQNPTKKMLLLNIKADFPTNSTADM